MPDINMSIDIHEKITAAAKSAYDKLNKHSTNESAYEKGLSEELLERDILHETHKKVYDEHRGKYRHINIYLPDHKLFIDVRKRKYITRAELHQLQEDEAITGYTGILINFYDGVDIRDSGSITARVSTRSNSPQRKSRNFKATKRFSSSTGRLSDPSEYSLNGHRTFQLLNSTTEIPKPNVDYGRIFALTCAAFFYSGGERSKFAKTLNDFLKEMKYSPLKFPLEYMKGDKLKVPATDIEDIIKVVLSKGAKPEDSIEERLGTPTNEDISHSEDITWNSSHEE